MSSVNIFRQFSRQGVGFVRFSQDEVSTVSRGSDLIYKTAVLMAFCGVSFSFFAASQLQDSKTKSSNANPGIEC